MSYSCQKSSKGIRQPPSDYLNCGAIPIRPCRWDRIHQLYFVWNLLSLRSHCLYEIKRCLLRQEGISSPSVYDAMSPPYQSHECLRIAYGDAMPTKKDSRPIVVSPCCVKCGKEDSNLHGVNPH
jgi:hypothetical protein